MINEEIDKEHSPKQKCGEKNNWMDAKKQV